MTRPLSCRIPATPHKLLNPNVVRVTPQERKKLDWPLAGKSVHVIKYALRAELRETTMLAALEARPAKPMTGPVAPRVVIAYEKGRKALDWDNAIATTKGIWDGLVDAGWIVDDNQMTGIFLTQIKDPEGRGYIDVTMEEAA